jgi:hypothetical protein
MQNMYFLKVVVFLIFRVVCNFVKFTLVFLHDTCYPLILIYKVNRYL